MRERGPQSIEEKEVKVPQKWLQPTPRGRVLLSLDWDSLTIQSLANSSSWREVIPRYSPALRAFLGEAAVPAFWRVVLCRVTGAGWRETEGTLMWGRPNRSDQGIWGSLGTTLTGSNRRFNRSGLQKCQVIFFSTPENMVWSITVANHKGLPKQC